MEDPNQGSSTSSGRRTRRRNREIETLSLEIKNNPRDLLHTFLSTDPNQKRQSIEEEEEEEEEEGEGEDEEMEFNLGLSLGGRFGVDKSHRVLIKSSSIAGELPCVREGGEEEVAPPPTPAAALARASSLPSVTEDECRRRKATLRRMEAKRRRSEKQRGVKENSGAGEERERPGKLNPGPGPGHGLPGPGFQGKGGFFRSLQGLLAHQQQQQQRSQESGESQGGGVGSSGESKTHQQGSGGGSGGEAKSPASTQSMQMQERGSQESPMGLSSGTKCGEGSSKQPETPDDRKKEAGNSKVENMPSVFTIGDGPNGRKVEGILYKYGKGEEARIMCVCHGSFFTPAEFVKHSGGRDVDHPLRHIVVNPSSTAFH